MDTKDKTIINIKTDKTLKREAQEIAKDMGIPLGMAINAVYSDLLALIRALSFKISSLYSSSVNSIIILIPVSYASVMKFST